MIGNRSKETAHCLNFQDTNINVYTIVTTPFFKGNFYDTYLIKTHSLLWYTYEINHGWPWFTIHWRGDEIPLYVYLDGKTLVN